MPAPIATNLVRATLSPQGLRPHMRRGAEELRLFGLLTTIGTPLDVTAQELTIESLFPADDVSERWFLVPPVGLILKPAAGEEGRLVPAGARRPGSLFVGLCLCAQAQGPPELGTAARTLRRPAGPGVSVGAWLGAGLAPNLPRSGTSAASTAAAKPTAKSVTHAHALLRYPLSLQSIRLSLPLAACGGIAVRSGPSSPFNLQLLYKP